MNQNASTVHSRSLRARLLAASVLTVSALAASSALAYHADPYVFDTYCEGDTPTIEYEIVSWANLAYSSENPDIRVEVSVDGGEWIEIGSGSLECTGGYVTVEVDPGRFEDRCGDQQNPSFSGTAPLPEEGDSYRLRARPAAPWGELFIDEEPWYAAPIGGAATPDEALAGDFAVTLCDDDDDDDDDHGCGGWGWGGWGRGHDRDDDDDDHGWGGWGRGHDRDDDDDDHGWGGWGRGHDRDDDDDDDHGRGGWGRGHDRDDDDDDDRGWGRGRSGGRGWW
jgi:hypothetical protein